MNLLPLQALATGMKLCLGNKTIRHLALGPWIIGIFSSIASMIGAYYAHGVVVAHFIGTPQGFLSWLAYLAVWLGTAVLLIAVALLVSFLLVMLLAGIFQNSIAEYILMEMKNPAPTPGSTPTALAREILRSISVESVKLLWLIPVFMLLFLLGFVPLFLPVVFVLSAWLLAYQAVDFALDVLKYSAGQRLNYALKHFMPLMLFGMGLLGLALIPLAIILLPPIAVAGGTFLVSELQKDPRSN